MKKLKLESLEFNPPEILSRMQLKHVMGGDDGSGSGSGSGSGKDCSVGADGCTGFATTASVCDPCPDVTVSTTDMGNCCFGG